jgi:DNA-directed RNA polymerase specialized sigma24 family protein
MTQFYPDPGNGGPTMSAHLTLADLLVEHGYISIDASTPKRVRTVLATARRRGIPISSEDAEDLLQDAVEALLRTSTPFDPMRGVPFPAFVSACINNRLKDWARTSLRRSRIDKEALSCDAGETGAPAVCGDAFPSPEACIGRLHSRAVIERLRPAMRQDALPRLLRLIEAAGALSVAERKEKQRLCENGRRVSSQLDGLPSARPQPPDQ